MANAAGPQLAAAVTNAGGMGCVGGVGYTPEFLQVKIDELKADLVDKNGPFGIDLLLPQVGGNARATNRDYTGGTLPKLVDVIIKNKAKLFICAVGVPPKWVVDKFHAHGIVVMNMIGSPNHVQKALDQGVDIICAQGGEGGGHTGEIATSILVPIVVDMVKGKMSPLLQRQVPVIAAGGIFDGRGLAMALSLGAQGVWVGTRFVASTESGASVAHKKAVTQAGVHDTVRTVIFTGRPMRVFKNDYVMDWETNKQDKIKELTKQGILPREWDVKQRKSKGEDVNEFMYGRSFLTGQCAGAIRDVKPAKEIIDDMVGVCIAILNSNQKRIRANL